MGENGKGLKKYKEEEVPSALIYRQRGTRTHRARDGNQRDETRSIQPTYLVVTLPRQGATFFQRHQSL